MSNMNLNDVRNIVQEARDKFRIPNLSGADLYGANLHRADLYEANLHRADLHRANLHRADLHRADLHEANLSGADGWDGLQITGLYRYQIQLTPGPEGWSITIGCWIGTPDDLAALISQDDGWPESEGEEIPRNRALLEAALTVIREHMADHPGAVYKAIDARQGWESKGE